MNRRGFLGFLGITAAAPLAGFRAERRPNVGPIIFTCWVTVGNEKKLFPVRRFVGFELAKQPEGEGPQFRMIDDLVMEGPTRVSRIALFWSEKAVHPFFDREFPYMNLLAGDTLRSTTTLTMGDVNEYMTSSLKEVSKL